MKGSMTPNPRLNKSEEITSKARSTSKDNKHHRHVEVDFVLSQGYSYDDGQKGRSTAKGQTLFTNCQAARHHFVSLVCPLHTCLHHAFLHSPSFTISSDVAGRWKLILAAVQHSRHHGVRACVHGHCVQFCNSKYLILYFSLSCFNSI